MIKIRSRMYEPVRSNSGDISLTSSGRETKVSFRMQISSALHVDVPGASHIEKKVLDLIIRMRGKNSIAVTEFADNRA